MVVIGFNVDGYSLDGDGVFAPKCGYSEKQPGILNNWLFESALFPYVIFNGAT